MKNAKVIALPEVREYLSELIRILYEKEYFGFEESAQRYVEELGADIRHNLPTKIKKPAPSYFNKYGKMVSACVMLPSAKTRLLNGMFSSILIKMEMR